MVMDTVKQKSVIPCKIQLSLRCSFIGQLRVLTELPGDEISEVLVLAACPNVLFQRLEQLAVHPSDPHDIWIFTQTCIKEEEKINDKNSPPNQRKIKSNRNPPPGKRIELKTVTKELNESR